MTGDPTADASADATVDPARVERLVGELARRGETVAAAESLTAGLFTAALTEVSGASRVVRGALVVYATDLKATLAGVPEALLADKGPVSEETAIALADGVRRRLDATYGVALTGVAGPDPVDGLPPGTVYVAVAGPVGSAVRRLTLSGDRAAVRTASVAGAIGLLEQSIPAERTG